MTTTRSFGRTPLAALLLALGVTACAAAPAANDAPAALTASEDHARLMALLGIDALRPGRNGLDPEAENYANYDEATSNPYPNLPDPLVTDDGRTVDSAEMWESVRRPEIVEAFDREIYGRTPERTPAVTWKVVSEEAGDVGGVPAVTQTLLGRVDNAADPAISVNIDLTITRPAAAEGPVPVILRLAFRWPPGVTPPPIEGPTPREQTLARGWAYAELVPTSVQADNGDGLADGIIGLVNGGAPRDADDWGALKAWTWGVSRVVDRFEADPATDGRRIALEGLSRYGKATLVAMAYEPRLALGMTSSSGAGGASLLRRDNGEIVENLAGSGEYHWMAGNFLKYAGPLGWDDLPVDAHELIALVAPRPLLIGSGLAEAGDAWVDPKGMFMAAAAASPVYELLGAEGLGTEDMPAPGTQVGGALAWRQHAGGHTSLPNWPAFMDFAAAWFGEL